MITNIHSNPDDILIETEEICTSVYSALIHGSVLTREYFDNQQKSLNKPLAANLTRYHAKDFLVQNQNPFAEYFLREVGNNGISIKAGVVNIKVVKGQNGDAPAPNRTRRDENFYRQNKIVIQPPLIKDVFKPFTVSEWEGFSKAASVLNLILCWEVDASYRITRLQLMCPRKIWKYQQRAEVFWKRFIKSPTLASSATPNINEQEVDDIDDLDVFFDDEDLGTGTDD